MGTSHSTVSTLTSCHPSSLALSTLAPVRHSLRHHHGSYARRQAAIRNCTHGDDSGSLSRSKIGAIIGNALYRNSPLPSSNLKFNKDAYTQPNMVTTRPHDTLTIGHTQPQPVSIPCLGHGRDLHDMPSFSPCDQGSPGMPWELYVYNGSIHPDPNRRIYSYTRVSSRSQS